MNGILSMKFGWIFCYPSTRNIDFEAPLRHSFIKVWLTMFAIERTREIIQKL